MSTLSRLAKSLHRNASSWADVETDEMLAEMGEIQFGAGLRTEGIDECYLATFKLTMPPDFRVAKGRREFTVTITESEIAR